MQYRTGVLVQENTGTETNALSAGDLTRHEFDALYLVRSCALDRRDADGALRALRSFEVMDDAESVFHELEERGLLEACNSPLCDTGVAGRWQLTEAGLGALAPYRVHNAVIMAAGFSSRFIPYSYEKPKGLLQVKHEVLIERQIRQLMEAGIDEIVVVVGYLKEQFYYLADLFPGLTLIENIEYLERNNHSTIAVAAEYLSNSYICSSDNYFTKNPFDDHVYQGYYSCVEGPDDAQEMLVQANEDGLITGLSWGGGAGCYLIGHVYWDETFTRKFLSILEEEYDLAETRGKLWEDVYQDHIAELALHQRTYPRGVILEFDSAEDLRLFDHNFIINTDNKAIKRISKALGCDPDAIHDIRPIKKGMTNLTFQFKVDDEEYVYRHPGLGTEILIDRKREAQVNEAALACGLDSSLIKIGRSGGYKVSNFVDVEEEFSAFDPKHLDLLFEKLDTLHSLDTTGVKKMDFWKEGKRLLKVMRHSGKLEYPGFATMMDRARELHRIAAREPQPLAICHHDIYGPNLLISDGDIVLIDWEYAGVDDPDTDYATFLINEELSEDLFWEVYWRALGDDRSEERILHFDAMIGLTSYFWFIWSLYQDYSGNPIEAEYQLSYYNNFNSFYERALEREARMDSASKES